MIRFLQYAGQLGEEVGEVFYMWPGTRSLSVFYSDRKTHTRKVRGSSPLASTNRRAFEGLFFFYPKMLIAAILCFILTVKLTRERSGNPICGFAGGISEFSEKSPQNHKFFLKYGKIRYPNCRYRIEVQRYICFQ